METLKISGKTLRYRLENEPLDPEIADKLTQDEMVLMSSNFIEQIEGVFSPDKDVYFEPGHRSLCVFQTPIGSYGTTLDWINESGWDIDDNTVYALKQVIGITRTEYLYG